MTYLFYICLDPPENVVITKSVEGPLLEGSDLTLTCTSGGNPTPNQSSWMKDGTVIENERCSQLVLEDVMTEHAGYYQCAARNGVGSDGRSQMVAVTVHCE